MILQDIDPKRKVCLMTVSEARQLIKDLEANIEESSKSPQQFGSSVTENVGFEFHVNGKLTAIIGGINFIVDSNSKW